MRLALYGLAASLALMLLRSRIARDTFARLLSVWRSLTAFGRVAVCSFLLIGILIGGDKTNNVPPNMNSPLPQMQQGGVFLTGLTGLTGFVGAGNLVNLVNPVQTTPAQNSFAERKAMNWNVRGAWKDSFWLPFEDGWVFPWGTNHLSGVEVISYGQVWATPFDTNAVASADTPFEIVRGLTSFAYELTPSNSYRFVWTDAAINRDTNNLVTAALELFRNGDVSVTTNGVAAYLPRVLPFSHNGFGQDTEWVSANFTNATEILAVGYSQWVDAHVGEGLTNGLYKLTVNVADDPPETTQISVGNLFIAVTNAGEYVFLLEKGEEYRIEFFPPSTSIAVSAFDDIPIARGAPLLRSTYSWGDGVWSVDVGEFMCDYAPGAPSARCWWLPTLFGTPDVVHLGPADDHVTFAAAIFDCVHPQNATFEWSVGEGLVAETPNEQTTVVTAVDIPSWRRVWMSVTAMFGSAGSLTSSLDFSTGTNSVPQSGISMSVPRMMFQNDDDDNKDGVVDFEVVDFGSDADSAENDVEKGSVVFSSDVSTNGIIRIGLSDFPGDVYTNDCESALVPASFDVAIQDETSRTVDLYFNPLSWAPYQVPAVTAVWIPEGGEPQTSAVPFSVVKPVAETICSDTVEHSVLGTNHVYTVNPCGVAVGDDAYFRIKVSPSAYPDSCIVWTNYDEHVSFVGGNTGRNVHVRGVSPGYAVLEVIIGGRTCQAPTFPLKVVEPQAFKITAWIVSDQKHIPARRIEDVRAMIAPLNDIYRQVGVSFYLDSVIVTNIPSAYSLLYDKNPDGGWDFDRLVDIGQGTGGIECYFVNDFIMTGNEKPPMAANTSTGLVMSARADSTTLAHEIGHAFGLSDVYVSAHEGQSGASSPSTLSVATNFICYACAPFDWNGGCRGRGEGGCRYYQKSTRMATIVPRLLMYGVHDGNGSKRDITIGPVDAVNYIGGGESTVWYDEFAPIGFFENGEKKSSPNHE
ncbi:MAG: hypothetical protein IJG18_10955, partial [Kiritimatiellae bacterium]|nr:hypothetical protein [Kiritimatiellia bacterium]